MNNIYLYKGDFNSLVVLISELIALKKIPYDIKPEYDYEPSLFQEEIYLEIRDVRKKVECLKSKIGSKIFRCVYYVYLSNNKNKEIIIYYFIKNAIIYGNKIFFYRNLNCVNDAIKISSRVLNEAHKLKGFLRFKEMKNNFFYATISPTNNVIPILSQHFKNRLSNECWIIKDCKRNIYALYDLKKIIYLMEEDIVKLNLELSDIEENIEILWKTFFKTIAIKERKNLKCQMNFMPKKYWNNIIEMED